MLKDLETHTALAPILETERLYCRIFTEADGEALYRLHSTPEVGNITIDGIQNEEQALRELHHFIRHQETYGYSQWMAFEKETDAFVGRVGFEFRQVNPELPAQMEIRYALFPQFWGKGYATELGHACIRWAKEHIQPERIVATASPLNKPSHKVLEKIGLRYIQDFPYKGRTLVFYSSSDFKEHD